MRSRIRDAQWHWGLLNYYWCQPDSRAIQILELDMVPAFSMVTRLMDSIPWRAILAAVALLPPGSTCAGFLRPLQRWPEMLRTSGECISPLRMLVSNKCSISPALEWLTSTLDSWKLGEVTGQMDELIGESDIGPDKHSCKFCIFTGRELGGQGMSLVGGRWWDNCNDSLV